MVEDEVEASEGCVEQGASGDEDQSAVQFRLLARREREGKKCAEDCHVVERNDQERF
ncbi:MAG: hypothetical protein WAM69_00275 [Candidatus Sulfotelmatobacter sp.]